MNLTQRFIFSLIISLEVAFTQSILANLLLVFLSVLSLLWRRISVKRLLGYLLLAAIPMVGTFLSFYLYGSGTASQNLHFGGVMASRILTFVYVGAWFSYRLDVYELMASLEQNLRLSTTFVYGILGAVSFIPRFKQALQSIRAAGLMRGQYLSILSPTLYFKAIVQALIWSESLAMAMTARGFQEGGQRSHYRLYPYRPFGWLIIVVVSLVWPVSVILFHIY